MNKFSADQNSNNLAKLSTHCLRFKKNELFKKGFSTAATSVKLFLARQNQFYCMLLQAEWDSNSATRADYRPQSRYWKC